MARYAEGTTVSVESSRGEITGILAKHGVQKMGWSSEPIGDSLMFELGGYTFRFFIAKPTLEDVKRAYIDAGGRWNLVYDPPIPDCAGIPQSQRAVSPIHSWNSPGSREVADIMDDLLDTLVPPRTPEPRVSIRRFLT